MESEIKNEVFVVLEDELKNLKLAVEKEGKRGKKGGKGGKKGGKKGKKVWILFLFNKYRKKEKRVRRKKISQQTVQWNHLSKN